LKIQVKANVQLQTSGCGTGGKIDIDLPSATD